MQLPILIDQCSDATARLARSAQPDAPVVAASAPVRRHRGTVAGRRLTAVLSRRSAERPAPGGG